ncbi:porin [Massilia endophytica]|uniref:porin n=1 Tax=Massilia endophytica TaxID=2899220 RepID=UPI001E3F487C|nr:porin [Massilia endophytica]UGQ46191.1 porin [Massilia endophytica]
MKRSILTAAVLAALSSHAFAQSGVVVYGSFDGGLRHETNIDPEGSSVTTMSSNGTFRSNRLGFRGSEDIGNGMKVNFVLEAGFNSGTGALNNTNGVLFQREAHVGVSGKYGAIDMGRNYTAAYRTIIAFDPFKYRYPSVTYVLSSTAGTRKDNDIQYTGRFGDWTARAEYALGEQPGSSDNGTTKALGLNYSANGLKAGAVYTKSEQNVGTAANQNYRDFDHYAFGASYELGPVTFAAGHVKQEQATTTRDNTSTWDWVGASYQVTERFDITGALYRNKAYNTKASAAAAVGDSRKDLLMLGVTYELSRRTTLYAELDRTKLEGGFATGGTTKLNQTRQRGMAAGMMHTF